MAWNPGPGTIPGAVPSAERTRAAGQPRCASGAAPPRASGKFPHPALNAGAPAGISAESRKPGTRPGSLPAGRLRASAPQGESSHRPDTVLPGGTCERGARRPPRAAGEGVVAEQSPEKPLAPRPEARCGGAPPQRRRSCSVSASPRQTPRSSQPEIESQTSRIVAAPGGAPSMGIDPCAGTGSSRPHRQRAEEPTHTRCFGRAFADQPLAERLGVETGKSRAARHDRPARGRESRGGSRCGSARLRAASPA